jgi:hypothetical protein
VNKTQSFERRLKKPYPPGLWVGPPGEHHKGIRIPPDMHKVVKARTCLDKYRAWCEDQV